MTQPLPGIDHVVVLMLENRSFDNVFGGLYPASKGFHGLTGNESNYNPHKPDPGEITVWQAPYSLDAGTIPNPDPGEEFTDMNYQIFETENPDACALPTMGGFAANYAIQKHARYPWGEGKAPNACDIMQYFCEANVPWSYKLAKQYSVSDSWFAAAPVQTISNRTFVHTGTASKIPGKNESRINNGDYTKDLTWDSIKNGSFVPPVTDTTIFEMLDNKFPQLKADECSFLFGRDKKLNWKVYYHDAPLSALCKYVYDNWCYDYPYGGNVYSFFEHSLSDKTNFEYDISNGILPKYSFIEPAYVSGFEYTANSNHPGGSYPDPVNLNGQYFQPGINIANGEALLANVYSTLVRYPEVFNRTLLIVTYDEHGGLYDHIKPGSAVSPFTSPVSNFNYDRYGVRVPAILINPRFALSVFRASDGIKIPDPCNPGQSFTTQLDHTSIIHTLCEQFALGKPPTPRAASSATLAGSIKEALDKSYTPVAEVMAAGVAALKENSQKSRDLGETNRLRNWFQSRKENEFPGNNLANAIFMTGAIAWYGKLRWSVYPLRELVDIDQNQVKALNEIGITNTQELKVAISSAGGVNHIANYLGIDPKHVLSWEQQTDFLKVPGISGDDAYLLAAAGLTSVSELASCGIDALHLVLTELMTRFGIASTLDKDDLKNWISQAKKIG